MTKLRDGYFHQVNSKVGDDNYLLKARGGYIGLHTGRNNEANKVVRTDENGYIQAGWINTTSGSMDGNTPARIYASYDGYIRYMTPGYFFSNLSNSGNNISITVGGQNRTLTVGYADNADSVDGYHVGDLDFRYTRTGWSFCSPSDNSMTGSTDLQDWVTNMYNQGGYKGYSSITVGSWWWVRSLDFSSPVGTIRTSGAMIVYSGDGSSNKNYKHFLVLDAYAELYGITSNEESWKYYSRFLNNRNYTDFVYSKYTSDSRYLRKDTNDSTPYQYSFTKTNDHAIQVGTIRGRAVGSQTGEYIHLYERVAIGSPSGWGSRNAPTYGLATYGGAWLATDTGNVTIGGTNQLASAWGSFNLTVGKDTNKVVIGYLNSSTNGVVVGGHNNALSEWAPLNIAGTTLYFRINETIKATIDSNGNFGIGTSTPGYKLHVNGTSYLNGETIISNSIKILPTVWSELFNDYGLASDYTSRYNTEEFLKSWVKYAYAKGAGYTVMSYISPNARGYIVADVYASGINSSSGLPEHITGRYYPHGGDCIIFGTSYGTWYYRTGLDSGNSYVTGGKGVIAGTTITQVSNADYASNADTVDNVHADQLVPKRHNAYFYPYITCSQYKTWYKVTLAHNGHYRDANSWYMLTMQINLGGSYSGGSNGRIFLSYYFYKASGQSGRYVVGDVRGIGIGCKLTDNGVTIKYDIANPTIFYIKANNNTYNSISIDTLTANDTAPSFDYRNTIIEPVDACPSNADQTVPLAFIETTNGSNLLYNNNVILHAGNWFSYGDTRYSLLSHTHDDRYYTETEADNRFVNVTGDTMTGSITMSSGAYIIFNGSLGAGTGSYHAFSGDNLYLAANKSGQKIYLESTYQSAPYFRNQYGDYVILHSGNYTSYLGYIGTTAVQASSAAQALTGITAFTFNGASSAGTNYITGSAGRIYFGGNFHIDSLGSNATYINHYTANNVYLVSGSSQGNVGIGTTSPSQKLHVNGAGIFNNTGSTSYNTDGITIGAGDYTGRYITAYGKTGTSYFNMGYAASYRNCAELLFNYSGSGSDSNYAGLSMYGGENTISVYAGYTKSTKYINAPGFVHPSYNSASYLLTSNGGAVNESKYLKNFGSSNYVTFTVGGDANTYYPVRIHNPADYYPYSFITISRAYNETAPDTWYTSTHKGGLSMCLFWNSSSYWDGNSSGGECFCVRLNETYCNMVAGMDRIIDGTVVWLRGGGATYHIHGMAGTSQGVTVYLESYTDHASRTFSPRTWEQRTPVSVRWPGYADGADYASSAGSVAWGNVTGKPFNWSGQSGQPTWLWGSNDGTNYYVWNPSNFSVNYAKSATSLGSGALKYMCSLYATSTYNAYKITTDWHKSSNIMPTINIRGYAYGSVRTIDCDIVMYHYYNTACNYSLTNKGSYPIRVWQDIENDVQVFYINPGEYFGMFNVFVYGGIGTDAFSNWSMTTVDSVSGTEIGSVPIATSITGNADTVDGYHASSFSLSTHTHTFNLGNTTITTNGDSYSGITGPFNIYTNASSSNAFTICRNSLAECVEHWVDDGQYHIDYTNDETSSSIHIRIINTDTESGNKTNTTDYHYYLDCYGNFYPGSNNTGSIGTSGYKWANMYATTFHGSLDGNATSATSATSATQATNLTPENTAHYFRDPNNSSWRGGMIWGSAGSESMSFVVANSGTRFQFVGGSDIANWGSSTWQSANPYLTIYSNGIVTPGSATASGGFIKSGYNDDYVLLAGGGHKAESDLSVSYASSAGSVNYANSAGNADYATSAGSVAWSNVTGKPFNWSGQSGQPTWLWGSNDGTNYYVWDPSNFSVNYADSAGSAERARYLTCPDTRSLAPAPGDYTATSTGVSFDFKESSVTGLSGYSGVMTFRPYASAQDWTGGEVHQIAFLAGGGLYHRIGTSSWDSWERILTSSNWSSYISIPSVGNDTNYYPIRSYTSGLQISSYSGSTDCALFVPYATANQAGVVSTETQTFSGQKTFSSIRLRSTDTVNFGGYLYFGDGSYAYLAELADDQLTLNASKIFLGISGSQKYYIDGTIFRPVTANSTSDSGIALGSSDYRFTCGYFSDKVYAYKGFYESSDERLKRILNSVKVNLDDLSKLRKVYYLWKDRTEDGIQLGMIAQDVQRLYPELVSVDKETGYLSLAYDKLSVLALEAIDVLYKEHKKLKKHVDELEKLLINNKIY